ncbi:MAG: LptF/LptG family permease [Candidatus Melainabacteria bacterium]|nr:LptF/LptG family permease [Candidatus Melainabacteria bacterium]
MIKSIQKIFFSKVNILDKYIINEFWIPFVSGSAIITGIWLSADQLRQVFKLITMSDAPISLAITILGLHMPGIIVITIPIGVLWSTFLVFSRLNNDSEIIAMRTSGISLIKVLKPVFLFGLLAAFLSFAINEIIVPFSNPLARKLEIYSIYKNPFPNSQKNFTYLEKTSKKQLRRIFYAGYYNADKDILKNIVVLDFTRTGLTQIYSAKTARWRPEKGGWELYNGTNHFISNDENLSRVSSFDVFFIPSGSTPAKLIRELHKPKEMNLFRLWNFLQLQKDSTINTDDYNEAIVTFHGKFAQPIACLLIALIGAPLGILPRRSSSSWNYIILALIIFQFYISQSVCNSLAETNKIMPFFAAWFPNLVLAAIAVFIIRQKAKLV